MVEKAHRQARKELVRIAGSQGLLKNFKAFQEWLISLARSSTPSSRSALSGKGEG